MFTLLSECHFWTIREEIRIKSTDFGAFRYMRNRELQQQCQVHYQQQQHHHSRDIASVAKRDYTERRNGTVVPKNTRKSGRLKDNIKKLEELLHVHKLVYSQWEDASQVLLLFANGIIAHICVDVYTCDILHMVFEKYFIGKLAADTITDAFFTRSHIVLAYNTNQLTVVYLQKQNTRQLGPEKIANLDPRIFQVIIPGGGERKLSRHLSVNCSVEMFVVWTKSSQNEVYPWRPTIRDQDRANIHVFKIKGMQLESIAYCWSENDPLCVEFLRSTGSQILTVEQKMSCKGEISVEVCNYEIGSGKMQRTVLSSIAMSTQICCYALSPDQEKLFLATVDRNACLHDLVQQSIKFVSQIDIIPTLCTWHCDSSVIMIANADSQFQCFDLALSMIGSQLLSDDVTPANLLDLSHYFITQPALRAITFSRKPDLISFSNSYAQTDCFLLLVFENGPIGCLRIFAGAGMRGDIHNSGLTADVLIEKYLALNQQERAVNLLVALNWETYGAMCLISLHKIANYVFYRSETKRLRVELMTKALNTFNDSLSEETKDDFSDQVFDLKRRFFFFLLRKNFLAEAFEVAQDIEDYDLFMDLFNLTKSSTEMIEFGGTAFSQAVAILHEEDRLNGNLSLIGDHRSESVCSQSSSSELADSKAKNPPNNVLKNYVPPLPSVTSRVLNAQMIKINIPKPELRVENTFTEQRSRPSQSPLGADTTRYLKVTSTNPISTCGTSTLAALAMKSGSITNGEQRLHINGNRDEVSPNSSWQEEIPDQTVGIPTILNAPTSPYTPSTAHNILPRASTTGLSASIASKNISQSHLQHYPIPSVHYATPAIVSEHALLPIHRSYQQIAPLPAPIYQPKFFQHPLVSGTIPPTSIVYINEESQKRLLMRKPTASILSNSSTQSGQNGNVGPSTTSIERVGLTIESGSNRITQNRESGSGTKNIAGEKNKVKFSDTVQVAVVPEIPRKDKSVLAKRNGYSRPITRNITNPKKELADSLPLCHPHDDYLKDFNPLSSDNIHYPLKAVSKESHTSANKSPPPSIKVVHFGVV